MAVYVACASGQSSLDLKNAVDLLATKVLEKMLVKYSYFIECPRKIDLIGYYYIYNNLFFKEINY